jgi:hypothetical protein
MKFLIQHNLFAEFNREKLIETLDRYELEYSYFIPFDNVILSSEDINGEIVTSPFIVPTDKTWCFGSVSAAKYMSLLDIKPGSMMNSNHDVEVYGKYYDMLNDTNHVMNFSDPLPDWLPEAFFARPTKDSKCFSGSLFMKSSWHEYVNTILEKGNHLSAKADTKVLVAPLRTIYKEVRCFVIKGKVITCSQYKINGVVRYSADVEPYIIEYAQSQVDKFQVADAFVIDIALTDQGLKVVEVNCLNCSGFYEINVPKLIESIIENF